MTENITAKKNLLYVHTIELLYRCADAGVLEKLVGVTFKPTDRKYKTFVFNYDPIIERLINEYRAEKKKVYQIDMPKISIHKTDRVFKGKKLHTGEFIYGEDITLNKCFNSQRYIVDIINNGKPCSVYGNSVELLKDNEWTEYHFPNEKDIEII